MIRWLVFLNGEVIDIVYSLESNPDLVRRSLIDHDGYDAGISVEIGQ